MSLMNFLKNSPAWITVLVLGIVLLTLEGRVPHAHLFSYGVFLAVPGSGLGRTLYRGLFETYDSQGHSGYRADYELSRFRKNVVPWFFFINNGCLFLGLVFIAVAVLKTSNVIG